VKSIGWGCSALFIICLSVLAFQHPLIEPDSYEVVSQYSGGTYTKVLYRGKQLTLACRTHCPLLNPGQHLQLERWTDNYHTKLFVLRWAGEDVEYSILEPFGYTDEIPWD
jgi:hypothetical protein